MYAHLATGSVTKQLSWEMYALKERNCLSDSSVQWLSGLFRSDLHPAFPKPSIVTAVLVASVEFD